MPGEAGLIKSHTGRKPECAVQTVAPAVIRAHQRVGLPTPFRYRGTAVSAAVHKSAQNTVTVTRQHQGAQRGLRCIVAASLGHIVAVAHEQPCVRKYPLAFSCKKRSGCVRRWRQRACLRQRQHDVGTVFAQLCAEIRIWLHTRIVFFLACT